MITISFLYGLLGLLTWQLASACYIGSLTMTNTEGTEFRHDAHVGDAVMLTCIASSTLCSGEMSLYGPDITETAVKYGSTHSVKFELVTEGKQIYVCKLHRYGYGYVSSTEINVERNCKPTITVSSGTSASQGEPYTVTCINVCELEGILQLDLSIGGEHLRIGEEVYSTTLQYSNSYPKTGDYTFSCTLAYSSLTSEEITVLVEGPSTLSWWLILILVLVILLLVFTIMYYIWKTRVHGGPSQSAARFTNTVAAIVRFRRNNTATKAAGKETTAPSHAENIYEDDPIYAEYSDEETGPPYDNYLRPDVKGQPPALPTATIPAQQPVYNNLPEVIEPVMSPDDDEVIAINPVVSIPLEQPDYNNLPKVEEQVTSPDDVTAQKDDVIAINPVVSSPVEQPAYNNLPQVVKPAESRDSDENDISHHSGEDQIYENNIQNESF